MLQYSRKAQENKNIYSFVTFLKKNLSWANLANGEHCLPWMRLTNKLTNKNMSYPFVAIHQSLLRLYKLKLTVTREDSGPRSSLVCFVNGAIPDRDNGSIDLSSLTSLSENVRKPEWIARLLETDPCWCLVTCMNIKVVGSYCKCSEKKSPWFLN